MPDGPNDRGTARPAVKRVRSDNDHSKGETKAREAKRQGKEGHGGSGAEESGDGGDGEGDDKDKDTDEEWDKQAPFRVGADWEGWETVWRQSCWCGKGESGCRSVV
jgi:hypothetical protein